MKNKIKEYFNVLKNASRTDFKIIIGITLLFILIITLNFRLIFNVMSNQTEEIGQMQLESIRSELQTMLTDAENTTLRVAIEAEQMLSMNIPRYQLAAYFGKQQKEQAIIFKDGCMDVYIGGKDWAIIPGFDIPDDYHPPERIWYKGAVNNPGKVFITEPYIDARTGVMCFTLSTVLSDGQTVVAMDFNFSNTQKLIQQMTTEDNSKHALIVTNNGKIISYDNMSFVGENISKKLPEYVPILERIIKDNSFFHTELNGSTQTIFSSYTKNGWYMILSVDDFTLYKDSYKQVFLISVVSLLMIFFIVLFYLGGVKNRIKAEQALHVKEMFLSNLSQSLREPINRIITLSNSKSVNTLNNFTKIKESAAHLSSMIEDLLTFSTLVSDEPEKKKIKIPELSETSRKVRRGIIMALILAMFCSLSVYNNTVKHLSEAVMNREVDTYEYQLSNWISRQQSILSMFVNMIAERPEIVDDYDSAVKWLNDIAQNYPEISVCYLASPYREHTVIMNNGWQPRANWKVEERQWYIDTEKSDTGFNISTPYYDDQTGLYCITFSQVVYGRNGKFIGIFGIDFFLDKLIKILDDSYTDGSYAFLVDKKGTIINHPSDGYQLSIDNTTPIGTTKYKEAYVTGEIIKFTDYNDRYSTCLAKKNNESDFTVMVVNSWWNIYGNIAILAIFIIILFLICIASVDILINRLIHWQQEVNMQLKQSADTAMAAGKAKSQFLAQMSHEIRTPINVVIGMNEMILRECKDSTIIKYASNAYAASEALLSLINDILDFSKIESGKMELVEETYQLDELIKNLVNMTKSRAEQKNLELKVHVNDNIPNELFGDSVRIRQVVVNFLTNAVKYTQVGSIDFSVDFEGSADEINLIFSIKDTGIGIREEDKKKLFKDFERFDSKRNKNIEGTGLGLAITSKLVKMMKGQIEVESVYGEGSTFTVMLPQKVMGNEVVGSFEEKFKSIKTKKEAYKVSFVAPDAKILVVDDNEMNLLVATSLLKATKIQVDTAMSGMSALKKLAKKKYDLVFLDQMMPSLDGIQTLKLAKEMEENKSQEAPIIALTANAISGAKEMFLSEGFNDYLAKPINAAELEKMLMEYLPVDKLQAPPKQEPENSSQESSSAQESQNSTQPSEAPKFSYLNTELGLQYSAGMDDMYRNVLEMFCKLKDDKQTKMNKALESEDWNNYTTLVHALKSTSLSIGGEKCSNLAKELETAGKILSSATSSELDKHEAENYIKAHHAEAMELYDKLVDDSRNYLNEEFGMRNSESEKQSEIVNTSIEEEKVENIAEVNSADDDTNSALQEAFDNEDWVMYSILIDQISGVNKNIKMACQMITSDFTNDQEKTEAINYIKEHHANIMKTAAEE